jgi:phage terminase large subunit-like protein
VKVRNAKNARWVQNPSDNFAIGEGCWFDETAAKHAAEFFSRFLRHSKGEWAGKAFELLDWQRDKIIYPLFGWKRKDGTRRFRRAYIEVPKKNGKSTIMAGFSLYLLLADNEPGAEVYSVAWDREQAAIVYREAANMVGSSPQLQSRLVVQRSTKTIGYPATQSYYKTLSSEAAGAEGKNIHGLIFDELHAQRNRELWDSLVYGGASRRQPLLVAITTAGSDTDSICYEQHEYAEKVLSGVIPDASFFAFIAAAGKEDDWRAPATWKKANPSFGITIKADQFESDAMEAQQEPRKENAFRRYRLNQWTEQETRWLSMEHWKACKPGVRDEELLGFSCAVGLDLSTKLDLSAAVYLFRLNDRYRALCDFWIPEETAKRMERKHNIPYSRWIKEGWIEATPGDVIDYSRIRERLNERKAIYTIREIAFDPYNATHLVQELQTDELQMIEFRQGYLSMSPPSKELEKLVISGELDHGNNPVLTWMASNVAIDTDKRGNIAPVKPKPGSAKKIDGIVGLIMALGRTMVLEPEVSNLLEVRAI